jgi:hypothetical protein
VRTTCYLCGETDGSDLVSWGRNDYGWYHRACGEDFRRRVGDAMTRIALLRSSRFGQPCVSGCMVDGRPREAITQDGFCLDCVQP